MIIEKKNHNGSNGSLPHFKVTVIFFLVRIGVSHDGSHEWESPAMVHMVRMVRMGVSHILRITESLKKQKKNIFFNDKIICSSINIFF